MVARGTGNARSLAWTGPAPAASKSNPHANATESKILRTIPPLRSILFLRPIPGMALTQALGDGGEHVIGGLDDLRVHLIGALRRDELGNLLHRIDVGVLEVALIHAAKARFPRHADDGRARRRRLAVKIAAEWIEAGLIGEIGKRELADQLHGGIGAEAHEDLAGLVDGDFAGILRDRHGRLDHVAVGGNDLAGRVFVEGTGARIEALTVGTGDLKPAA